MENAAGEDPHDLARFITAQEATFDRALAELRAGRKRTHWMWFVFPQLAGLGRSQVARRYAIKDLDEARAYLNHPILGPRLLESAEAVLAAEAASARDLLGTPDGLKLRSSMTLFLLAAGGVEDDKQTLPGAAKTFRAVLDRYYDGSLDPLTTSLLDS